MILGIRYCGISLHHVSKEWQLLCFILGCFPFDFESSNAMNIRRFVEMKLEEFALKLDDRVYVVTDNEAKMAATFKTNSKRIGCSVHYVNKQLEHAFNKKEVEKSPVSCDLAQDLFELIRKHTAHIKRSHKQTKMSKRVQSYSETRFNGAYYMLNTYADVFDELSSILDHIYLQEYLSIEKDLLDQICSFLKVFDDVIEQLSDEKKPTIFKVLPFRQHLLNHCKTENDDHIGLNQIKSFLCK